VKINAILPHSFSREETLAFRHSQARIFSLQRVLEYKAVIPTT
jgi:predicted transposase YdaD